MDKRILVPTDFSKNALNAIHYILELYKKQTCEFYFLNVFHPESYTTRILLIPEPGSSQYEAAKSASEVKFAQLIDLLQSRHQNPKHTYHTISSNNFLAEAIEQTIAKQKINLVVMGTQGATGAKGIIFGSHTVNAMEKIRACPVLAVPDNVRFSPPRVILFPTNYKSTYDREELTYLTEIAKLYDASIKVLYVNNKPDLNETQVKNKRLLDELLETVDHSFHVQADKNVAEGLSTFAESSNSDMIAFINKKHYFFGSVFSKPLVKEIGFDATLPILALH